MDRQEVVDFVVSELVKHHSRDAIISSLCDNLGMPWADAEKFVKQVQAEHGRVIAARQSPLLVVIGIISIIAGCVVFAYGAIYFVNFFLMGYPLSALLTDLTTGRRRVPRSIIHLSALVAGLVWIAGSILGLWRIIKGLTKGE